MAILPNRKGWEWKMATKVKTQHEARAKIIKAMAHPSRLFIIEELNKQERCVGELTAMIGADASTVSKHLSVLKNAGLVMVEKRGNSIFYSLRVPCIMQFMGCVEEVLSSNAKEHRQILKCCKK
jgi:ArsR family transcriptional regulator, arsenate/arsenite/antimonite-responsive transcriptional repressor